MIRYEYRILFEKRLPTEQLLNDWGMVGYRLVQYLPVNSTRSHDFPYPFLMGYSIILMKEVNDEMEMASR